MDDINYHIGLINLRLDKLEKKDEECSHKDICVYVCVVYIFYIICYELYLKQ
jgi:hypothetical protein